MVSTPLACQPTSSSSLCLLLPLSPCWTLVCSSCPGFIQLFPPEQPLPGSVSSSALFSPNSASPALKAPHWPWDPSLLLLVSFFHPAGLVPNSAPEAPCDTPWCCQNTKDICLAPPFFQFGPALCPQPQQKVLSMVSYHKQS